MGTLQDTGSETNGERAGRERQRSIDAVATFVALIHAYERGELAAAAAAQAELDRLGVAVRFGRHRHKGAASV
jgi:adenosylmethionine-8-amino-7-oxononanoate aminotransferase